jgi:alkanesulfonate monooxygenase SsuD/methylene tetrahydromethanopterin reductase-like flavin-dependent oxidoreductase (luciferase family)
MQYGLALPNGGVDPQTMAEFAALAEASGWDGIFVEDYIVWQGNPSVPTFDPWVLLAAMAMRTTRVRLGTQITPLARRRPWKVASEAVTLDHLSNGRVILGVGLGDNVTLNDFSFSAFGEEMDAKRRAGMLDEALDILVGLWSGEPFSFDGEFYHVQEVRVLPRPAQTPRIPIWIGGAYPLKGPVQRAARWDGACLYRHKTHYMLPEDIAALKAVVESQRGTSAAFDISVGGSPRRANREEERAYIQSLAEAGATWWIEYVPPDGLDKMRASIAHGPLRIDC